MTSESKPKSDIRARDWVFTLNNYTEEEYNTFCNLPKVTYLIIGKEVGENGTPHLQGYISFENPRRLGGLKKINARTHWEKRMGTPDEAATYCKKEKNFIEKGDIPMGNGKKKGLTEACALLLNGTPIEEIATEYPEEYVRYSNGLKSLATIKVYPRNPIMPPIVIWLWGLAGVGKTREAYENHQAVYIKDGTQWWDGYSGQEAIIIDDFEVSEWNWRDLLRLLDRYPYRGQFKGGYVNINSPYIYITCEYSPEDLWTGNKLLQVIRRISQIREIKGEDPNLCRHKRHKENSDHENVPEKELCKDVSFTTTEPVTQGPVAQASIGNTNYACVAPVFSKLLKGEFSE